MPTYEYACPSCGHKFEEFQSITAKPVKVCPKCKGRKVKRLISAGAGLIFKGSGFYLTDYRKKGGEASTGGKTEREASASAPAETKTEPKTEAKPAAKAETKTAEKPAKSGKK